MTQPTHVRYAPDNYHGEAKNNSLNNGINYQIDREIEYSKFLQEQFDKAKHRNGPIPIPNSIIDAEDNKQNIVTEHTSAEQDLVTSVYQSTKNLFGFGKKNETDTNDPENK